MRIKTFFFFFSTISLLLVLGYSYYNFQKNYDLLLKNNAQTIQNNANEVRYNISSLVDEMMFKYHSNQELHEKIYFESLQRLLNNPNIKIEDIKKELELKYKDRVFNFYLINEDKVIYDSTFKSDIGLDFKKLPSVLNIINSVFSRDTFIDISQVILEDFSANFIQYYLHRPKGKNYMFQMGVIFNKDTIFQKYYKKLESISNFINYSIYNLTIEEYGTEYIYKLPLSHTFKDKAELHQKRDSQEEQFKIIYEKIFNEDMPIKVNDIEKKLKAEIIKNNGALGFIENTSGLYSKTILLPISNYQTFQDFNTMYQYIIMEFDVTKTHEEMEEFKKQNILFGLIYFSIIATLLYIVHKKVLSPLYVLEENMRKKGLVKSKNYLNKKNEIGSMMLTYNDLLKKLQKEIEKNQYLLNENKQFIADTVHQIRTPLSNIMMNGDMINLYKKDDSLSIFIDQINASINMLNNSYEDLSYITSYDTIAYEPTKQSLSNIVKKRVRFFDTISKVNKKQIVSNIQGSINFAINQIELERLIDNNISNGIKYADIDKTITISLIKQNNMACLTFKTFGKPIKNTSKLFVKNYRENSGKRGLGLGLFMVKNICEKYDISYAVTYEDNQNIFTYTFKIIV